MSMHVKVRLEGGPKDLPDDLRVQEVPAGFSKIKIRYGCGYEHFERTEDLLHGHDGPATIYRWTTRTRVAE
jgi:hypothetical protein